MTTYYEKLKDPRWQRMRLEILERDNWTCLACLATEKTLHVHHGFYAKGVDPWDYPGGTLRTLCDECHQHEQDQLATAHRLLAELASNDGLFYAINLLRELKEIRAGADCDGPLSEADIVGKVSAVLGSCFAITDDEQFAVLDQINSPIEA